MALSHDILTADARVFAAALRSAPRDEHGVVQVSGDKAASLASTLEELAAVIDAVRTGPSPSAFADECATVIRCGETIRIVGPDGRGVFATINARLQEPRPDRLAGKTDGRVIRQQGDELLLSDGERAVRVPISTALDALFPIAEALDKTRTADGEEVQDA